MIQKYIYENIYIIHSESMRNLQEPENKQKKKINKREMKTRVINRWVGAVAGLRREGQVGIAGFLPQEHSQRDLTAQRKPDASKDYSLKKAE